MKVRSALEAPRSCRTSGMGFSVANDSCVRAASKKAGREVGWPSQGPPRTSGQLGFQFQCPAVEKLMDLGVVACGFWELGGSPGMAFLQQGFWRWESSTRTNS